MTEKLSKKCKQCGKKFFKQVSDNKEYWKRKKYCSQKCASEAWIGHKPPKSAFKKGHIPWNKGKKHSIETRKKISEIQKGKRISLETRKKMSEAHKGEKAYQWKGGITKMKGYSKIYNRAYRARKFDAKGSHTEGEWELLKRQYGYTCPSCGEKEPFEKLQHKLLTEDHIIPLTKGGSDYIENIQPLCQSCNSKKHTKIIHY